jgi:hypothetical protein
VLSARTFSTTRLAIYMLDDLQLAFQKLLFRLIDPIFVCCDDTNSYLTLIKKLISK